MAGVVASAEELEQDETGARFYPMLVTLKLLDDGTQIRVVATAGVR